MNIAKIKKYSIANGEGVRISIYISGCQFYCKECFNPETWDYNYGELYTDQIKKEIEDVLKTNRVDGISLLGGDPLWQTIEDMKMIIDLCNLSHKYNKNVWIWSGFTWEQIFNNDNNPIAQMQQEVIKQTDVFVDGLFINEKKDLRLKWCGSTNQRVIDVKKSLDKNKIILYNEG